MKNSFILAISVFLALMLLISLGTWQVKRLAWKTALIGNLHQRVKQKPIALQNAIDGYLKKEDVEYLPVVVRGTFLHQSEKHLYALDKNGRPGWHIYTLLLIAKGDCVGCTNREQFIYINRGFVPYDLKKRAKRPLGQISGPVDITGLIRIPRKNKSYVEADNQPVKNQWYWPSWSEMSAYDARSIALPTNQFAPLFMEQLIDDNTKDQSNDKFYKWPRAGVTRIDIANRHLGYVITWYGLALALLGVYGFFLYGNKRRIGDSE